MPEINQKEFEGALLISENKDYSEYSPGDATHPLQPIAVSPSTENIANSLGKAARWIEVIDDKADKADNLSASSGINIYGDGSTGNPKQITNTGVNSVENTTAGDTSATNGDIRIVNKTVSASGVVSDSVTYVKPKGINDPAFKALDSSTSGLTSDDDHVPTSKTVQDAIDTALASASVYKGTISAFNDLPTSTSTDIVRKGWYYRVSTAWEAATGTPDTHVGDIIIAEIDSPSKAIDSTNWSLLHNEANTDANVAQTPVSANGNYEVLFSGSADNTAHTEGTGKDSGLTYNPSTNKLTVSGEISATSYSGLPEGDTTTKGIVQLGTDADKAASGTHDHGNITNGGALQTTDVSIASGDKLVITDASDSNKVARTSAAFDGSTETECLTKKGTFAAFNNYTHPTDPGNKHIPANGATGNYLKYGGSSGTAAWAAPLTEWPVTAAHTDTLPSTKLIDDRFKTNENDISSILDGTTIDSFGDVETALSGKQATLTTAQLAAVNSGIDSDDKTKLDGIEAGANKTTVDSALSSTSTNPLQNKVINTALGNKIDTDGTGLSKDGTTLNHSNSVTPVETAGAYKVKYDAQGHITGSSPLSASDISAVPTSRTINTKALTEDITLSASDVDAVPTARTINNKALSSNITLDGSDIALTGYTKGSSTEALAATDKINAAFAKHENRIDTNQSDISYTLGKTGKNFFNYDKWVDGITAIRGTVTVSGKSFTVTATENDAYTATSTAAITENHKIPVKQGETIVLSWVADMSQGTGNGYVYIFPNNSATGETHAYANAEALIFTVPSDCEFITIRFGVVRSGEAITFSDIMICTEEDWNVSPDYQPYQGLPNTDLTRLEAEDRAALTEVVDSGAKNLFNFATASWSSYASTYTKDDTSISVTTSASGDSGCVRTSQYYFDTGEYVLSVEVSNITVISSSRVQIAIVQNNSVIQAAAWDGVSSKIVLRFTIEEAANYSIYLYACRFSFTQSASVTFSNIMLTTKAQFDLSNTYQPYAKTNPELTQLEAEDRAALIEQVDNGAKNLIPYPYIGGNSRTDKGITYMSDENGIISITGTCDGTGNSYFPLIPEANPQQILKSGKEYIMFAKIEGTGYLTAVFINEIVNGTATDIVSIYNLESGNYNSTFTFIASEGTEGISVGIKIGSTVTNVQNLKVSLMICTKAQFDLSSEYQPYAENNVTLTKEVNILRTSMDNLFRTPVFGFRIDKNESDSPTAVEYLYDAVGMTPAYMDFTNSTFNYGSWSDAWFVKNNKPVALNFDGTEAFELDPTNYWLKSDGTTDSGIEDESTAYNFMSRFPLVYINRWEDENYNYVAISERPVTPNFLAQAHTGLNGTINSNIYLPMFKGWIDGSTGGTISSTGKLRSLAGKWPSCGTDATEEFNAIKNITGSDTSGWQLFAHSQYCLLNDLLTLISKSIDVKACFGRGDISTYTTADSTVQDGSKTGYANNGKYITGYEGYASGTTTKSTCGQFFGYDDATHHITAFFVQDPWGNRWDRSPGLNRINRAYKVKMTPPYSMNSDSSYITAGIQTPSSANWLRKISSSNEYGHLPFAVGDGAADTKNKYFWSYFYTNANTDEKLSLVGGSCRNGGRCSSRYVDLVNASSYRSWHIGGSPCFVSP